MNTTDAGVPILVSRQGPPNYQVCQPQPRLRQQEGPLHSCEAAMLDSVRPSEDKNHGNNHLGTKDPRYASIRSSLNLCNDLK